MGRPLQLVALALFVAAAAGCAPSLRMVHQADTFFERCHSADYDPSVTPDKRSECWAIWLDHYTLGQDPERLAYARGRLSGDDVTPIPGLPTAELGDSYTVSYLALEGETTSGDEQPPRDPSADAQRRPQAPHGDHLCASVCTPRWDTCIRRCDDPHGACRDACETEHRTCLSGCF